MHITKFNRFSSDFLFIFLQTLPLELLLPCVTLQSPSFFFPAYLVSFTDFSSSACPLNKIKHIVFLEPSCTYLFLEWCTTYFSMEIHPYATSCQSCVFSLDLFFLSPNFYAQTFEYTYSFTWNTILHFNLNFCSKPNPPLFVPYHRWRIPFFTYAKT